MSTITLRSVKGSPLTHAEMDANLTNLNTDKLEASDLTAAIGVTVQAYDADLTTWGGKTAPSGTVVGHTDTQTLTNKTIVVASNTITTASSGSLAATELNAALAELQTDIDTRAVAATSATLSANTFTGDQTLGNNNLKTIKTATFNSQVALATTTGAVTIDWSAAQNYKQNEPTGTITYTFTAPAGPCHLQLLIDSDGTSTAQTITWPGTVIWIGATWAGANNKKAIINFWYDGTSYYAMGGNQV